MLNRLSSVLQSAADALAPPPPPLEDLKYHWKMVMRFYAQRTIQSKCPIEETNIPSHLEQLLKILIAEDASTKHSSSEGPCTTAGPCLEFLLQHRLLELLVSLARADSPPGMRRYLLGYLRRLVAAISPHLLTMASIHLPLLRIVLLCSQSKASPTEAEEIEFLLALCQIVHRHPYLTIIFNKETKANKASCSTSSVSSNNQVQSESNTMTVPALETSPITSNTIEDKRCKKIDYSAEGNGKTVSVSNCGTSADYERIDEYDETGSKVVLEDKVGFEMKESDIKGVNSNIVSGSGSQQNLKDGLMEPSSLRENCRPVRPESTERFEKASTQVSDEILSQHSRTTSGSCTPEPFLIEDCAEPETGEGRLPLLDAVLGYINSADSVTKLHVCEALLMLVSVADELFSSAIARTSTLGLVMAEKLISSFQEIPADIDPDYFEDIPLNWGPKSSQLWLEEHAFPGSRLVASFVSWLNFCDQLTLESPAEVAESVAGAVRALFFEIELESELRTGDTVRQQLITNIICLSLRHITSNILMTELYGWLIGDLPEDPEVHEDTSLRRLLVNNCLHSNTHLSLNSMRLFELTLASCDEIVLQSLVLRYLSSRAYYDTSSDQDKSCMASWSDEEDARERDVVKNKLDPEAAGVASRTFAPSNIHKIIDSFLQLLPSSLRSALDYQESGYHQYVAEAQRQYTQYVERCSTMGWGIEAVFPDESDLLTTKEKFDEGPFLQMIFTRLRGLANQPYELNLQLTALVSRLAMVPHPHLHEFLLNPLIPLVSGTTSLYTTLQAVAREMHSAMASVPNSRKMLLRTRQELLGDVTYNHEFSGETSSLLESVVVLEEFCKELAAIVYVKYHHAS